MTCKHPCRRQLLRVLKNKLIPTHLICADRNIPVCSRFIPFNGELIRRQSSTPDPGWRGWPWGLIECCWWGKQNTISKNKRIQNYQNLQSNHGFGRRTCWRFLLFREWRKGKEKKLSFTFFKMGFQQSRSKIVRLPGNEVVQIQLQLHCEGQVFPGKLCIQSCLQKKIE